ncbi:MAG: PAS domain-containing protein [Alteromonadaceae bacterium]|nr:PAS domain-containing protein [Alteromonadaceae bacterium]
MDKFFEIADDLMLITDVEGYVQTCNAPSQSLFTHHAFDLEKLRLHDLIHDKDRDVFETAFAKLKQDKFAKKLTSRIKGETEAVVWIEWNCRIHETENSIYWIGRDVTEFKRMEAFLGILEQVTGTGAWELELGSDIIHWSDKIHDIHETDSNTYVPEIEQALAFYRSDAIPVLIEALERQEKTGEAYSLQLPFKTSKGRDITVNARGFTQTRDGQIIRRYGTFKDVTEEVAAELEKQKMVKRTTLALDFSEIGVWELNVNDDSLVWDEQVFNIYGVKPENFGGHFQDWKNAVHEEDLQRVLLQLEDTMRSGKRLVTQFRIRTEAAHIRYVKAMASNVYDEEGKLTHVLGVNIDVTAEVQQKKLLQMAKERSEAADKAKSRFLATMSHEIRTPLNGIIGGLQLIDQETLAPQQQTLAQRALTSSQSLLAIINDILDFTKISENKIQLDIIPVDLHKQFQQILDEQSLLLEDKNLGLRLDYDAGTSDWYKVDPVRLRQIVINLVGNAIKFTESGEVVIKVSTQTVNNKELLQIQIIDSGIGMNEEQLKNLFAPFVQADVSTTRKFGGTGLGLAIVKKLVGIMKGQIGVTSEPGQGTCFTIGLPLKVCAQSDVLSVDEDAELQVAPDLSNKRIIVAEDNELNQMLIEIMVQETGAEIVLVENGQLLLDKLAQENFDIVLCDINMPVMDGITACKRIREKDKKMPMFAFTANVMDEDVAHYKEIGFDEIISKPVIKGDLFKKLLRFSS